MTETDDCRRYAVECERLAEIANDPKIKQELRSLAQAWLQMDVSDSSDQIPMEPSTLPTSPTETAKVSADAG